MSNEVLHYCDVIWGSWCLISPAAWLFVQQLVHSNNKENIKALYSWPLIKGTHCTSDQWIPLTKGWWCVKCLHVMTLCHGSFYLFLWSSYLTCEVVVLSYISCIVFSSNVSNHWNLNDYENKPAPNIACYKWIGFTEVAGVGHLGSFTQVHPNRQTKFRWPYWITK